MDSIKIGNKILIGNLETEVIGYSYEGSSFYLETPYGPFHINLCKKIEE